MLRSRVFERVHREGLWAPHASDEEGDFMSIGEKLFIDAPDNA